MGYMWCIFYINGQVIRFIVKKSLPNLLVKHGNIKMEHLLLYLEITNRLFCEIAD